MTNTIRCKKCGNSLKEHGKDFSVFLTDKQMLQLKGEVLDNSVEAFEEPAYECLRCNTKLSLEDLCVSIDEELKEIIYDTKSQSKNGSD